MYLYLSQRGVIRIKFCMDKLCIILAYSKHAIMVAIVLG